MLRNAVVAIEDERFYRHNGVDLRALMRAVRANAEAGEVSEGGSTITQQYVKQVLLRDSSRTVERKLQEASLALQLERHYSKDHILELYLNAVYFGNGAYGVAAAAAAVLRQAGVGAGPRGERAAGRADPAAHGERPLRQPGLGHRPAQPRARPDGARTTTPPRPTSTRRRPARSPSAPPPPRRPSATRRRTSSSR